jgi:hypothetical protein
LPDSLSLSLSADHIVAPTALRPCRRCRDHTYPTPIEPPTLVETVGAGCQRCWFCCFGGGLAELSQHTLVLVRVGCAGTTTYRTCVHKITLWGGGGWGWC